MKLFFEQFHIRSAVLNAELPLLSRLSIIPLLSRLSIIDQFNAGNFDYLIATDESTDIVKGKKKSEKKQASKAMEETEFLEDSDAEDRPAKKLKEEASLAAKNGSKSEKNTKAKDSEYGVSRGVDFQGKSLFGPLFVFLLRCQLCSKCQLYCFQNVTYLYAESAGVSFIVNMDFPLTPESYTHRIGQTARGGAKGVALSFVEHDSPEQNEMLALLQASQPTVPIAKVSDDFLSAANDLASDVETQVQPSPLDFDLKDIEGFCYRVEDVSRAVTSIAVKEARAAELKAEILNSDCLQRHFAENPNDLQLLRHDRQATHVARIQDHLK